MARRTLLLKLGKDACLISRQPFGRHLRENLFPNCLAMPEWNNFIFIAVPHSFIDLERDFGALVENFKVLI